MKKTWIYLMLAVLLTAALAIPATASVTDPHCACGATTTVGTTCSGCGTAVYSDWKAWDQGTAPHFAANTTARYYLTGDLHLNAEMWVQNGANITIDLNGYDIYADGNNRKSRYCVVDYYHDNSTAATGATITITDTSAANTG